MSHQAEYDEHGHKDHGHFIVPAFTLRSVLLILLFFTLLTVGAARGEQWVSTTFNVVIPQWMNVFVALSIATVKTILVVMFFMQLKYDNPMNTLIFVFTVITVAFFLGFTAIDLGQRGTLDPRKSFNLMRGGTGGENLPFQNMPITQFARNNAIANGTYDPHGHHGHHGGTLSITNSGFLAPRPAIGSSANISRPVSSVTIPGLPGYQTPGDHGHHGAAAHSADAHAAPATPAAAPAHTEPAKPAH